MVRRRRTRGSVFSQTVYILCIFVGATLVTEEFLGVVATHWPAWYSGWVVAGRSYGGRASGAGVLYQSGVAAYLAALGLAGRGVEAAGYPEDGPEGHVAGDRRGC